MRWGMWEWRRCERVWFSVSLAGVVNQLLQKNYTHTVTYTLGECSAFLVSGSDPT